MRSAQNRLRHLKHGVAQALRRIHLRTVSFVVTVQQDGKPVGLLLQRTLHMAGGLIAHQKQIPGGILKNGVPVRTVDHAAAGDTLSICLPDAVDEGFRFSGRIPAPVVWEDDDLLVLNKPAGIAVHGAQEKGDVTVAQMLAAVCGPGFVFHPINRLDRGTSGLMVVAKNRYISDRLRLQLHTDAFLREYLAIVTGSPEPCDGVVRLPIARDPASHIRRCIAPSGLPSVTHYRTVLQRDKLSLISLRLETGRTHQIRVHMAAIGCPLAGDWLYGTPHPGIARCALHASSLRLIHPMTGQTLQLCIPLPDDMRAIF